MQPATDMTTKSSGAHAFNLLLNSLRQSGSLIETPFHSDDKRRAARYVAQLSVRYRWPDGDNWFNGMTGNISATGLLCVLDQPICALFAIAPRRLMTRSSWCSHSERPRHRRCPRQSAALPGMYEPSSAPNESSSTPSALPSTPGNSGRHREEDEATTIHLRARARITTHFRPPIHPAWRHCSSVEHRLYAPFSRLAMAERGMSTTPEKGHVFLRGPSVRGPRTCGLQGHDESRHRPPLRESACHEGPSYRHPRSL